MQRIFQILSVFIPLFFMTQSSPDCKDEHRNIHQLPCTFIERYGIDIIPDEETAAKYADIIIEQRELLVPKQVKPYKISLIAEDEVWQIKIKSNRCRYCYIYLNILKNTGEVLNYYRVEE